ncbi:hypothetical protein PUNSTDRAFT_119119 [Punctularia strigosozonata HHB-11173 SS5]|uniref:uncharacterized protein n=1 Tax=Punctularia strigosozonata (strain HHB-11173) TaxID=741275 RepID=UPI000441627A|nr:uncharacterized protein PUNSTDRAFT_119119 [Punctularia strigosozonata HHB-11173 SS5]EIN11919.1 hypothetical protein PUNSTDRAFT_119119 [Punctularia strigosozonata HHB-11173 SS5]
MSRSAPASSRSLLAAPKFSTHPKVLSDRPYDRPSPPPLPQEDQREFEELVRKAQTPLVAPSSAPASTTAVSAEADLALHPDARRPVAPEFIGDVNPVTGEQGGPKNEPVHRWREDEGDWSFKGRVSDF